MSDKKASAAFSLLALTLANTSFSFTGSSVRHKFQMPYPEMRKWGKRKRERYSELIELGKSSTEAFDIVENHQGIIPE